MLRLQQPLLQGSTAFYTTSSFCPSLLLKEEVQHNAKAEVQLLHVVHCCEDPLYFCTRGS